MKEGRPNKDAVGKFFAKSSQAYAGLFLSKKTGKNFIFRQRLSLATEAALETSGRMFDAATGSGEISAAIMTTGKFNQATLLDLSPQMLELASNQMRNNRAAENAAKVEFICEDVFRFAPMNSHRKYDLILCLGLIAHTGRLQELLLMLRAMLAKNGIILLQSTLLDHPGTRVERFLTRNRYFRKHGYRISYFRHRDIEAACAGAGLNITARKRHGLGLPFGDRLWDWGNYQLERIFQKWASAHGSEAIYILRTDAVS